MKLNITSAGKQAKFLHCETEFTILSSESVYLFNPEGGYMRLKSVPHPPNKKCENILRSIQRESIETL